MKQIEKILQGDKTEFKEQPELFKEEDRTNPDCWIHYAEYGEEDIPDYIKTHEERRTEAQIKNLQYDSKYRAEPSELYTE